MEVMYLLITAKCYAVLDVSQNMKLPTEKMFLTIINLSMPKDLLSVQ